LQVIYSKLRWAGRFTFPCRPVYNSYVSAGAPDARLEPPLRPQIW